MSTLRTLMSAGSSLDYTDNMPPFDTIEKKKVNKIYVNSFRNILKYFHIFYERILKFERTTTTSLLPLTIKAVPIQMKKRLKKLRKTKSRMIQS